MKRLFILVAIPCLLAHVVAACSPDLSVEQQIIAVIRDMEARVEAGERRPFMAHVAAEFIGQNGAVTRDQLNALVLYHLHQQKHLHAQLFPIHVTTSQPGVAEAHFRALVTGGPGWLPDKGQMYDITTRWQRQNDEWALISAHWQPVGVEDVLDL